MKIIIWGLIVLSILIVGTIGYRIYYLEDKNARRIEGILGINDTKNQDNVFDKLRLTFEKSIDGLYKSLPDTIPNNKKLTYNLIDQQTGQPTAHKWIKYGQMDPQLVNYRFLNYYNKKGLENTKEVNDDKYVFDKFTIIMLDELKEVKDYEGFSQKIWSFFFKEIIRPSNVQIGKVFIANENSFALYPYRSNSIKVDPTTRDWWISAFNTNSKSGLTNIYSDIVKEEGITDLNRTLWYKFEKYGKRYVFAIDLRLSGITASYLDEVYYEFIALFLCLIFLAILINREIRKKTSFQSGSRIYRLKRIGQRKIVQANSPEQEISIVNTVSIRNSSENKESFDGGFRLDIPLTPTFSRINFGIFRQKQTQINNSDILDVSIRKSYNLSLSHRPQNLKAVELWSVYKIDDSRFITGVIEALWLNTTENQLSLNTVYWDNNTTAASDDIKSALKKHLFTSENNSFINDNETLEDAEPKIMTSLKGCLDFVRESALRFESYKNRLLVFDNNLPILESIYSSNQFQIDAVCSIEFLEMLKRKEKLKELLSKRVNVRYIIDSDQKKFKTFLDSLDSDNKEFLAKRLEHHQIVEFKLGQEIIYRYRDFCILTFTGGAKCVLSTDMSDINAQKGWISWRNVDIEFYSELLEYIKSNMIDKRNANSYF